MASLLAPVAVAFLCLGIMAQMGQLATAIPGAGQVGRMDVLATSRAQLALVFGSACVDVAMASPGLIDANIPVAKLPAGVSTPVNSVCMTTAAGGAARNVYAYVPGVSGSAGQLASYSGASQLWYRVTSTGVAVNVSNGVSAAVPGSIPLNSLLLWTQTIS
jgi:hypothetical protein